MNYKNSLYPWLAKPGGELVRREGKKKDRKLGVKYTRPPVRLDDVLSEEELLEKVESYINNYTD